MMVVVWLTGVEQGIGFGYNPWFALSEAPYDAGHGEIIYSCLTAVKRVYG